jgi:hypothetical protein
VGERALELVQPSFLGVVEDEPGARRERDGDEAGVGGGIAAQVREQARRDDVVAHDGDRDVVGHEQAFGDERVRARQPHREIARGGGLERGEARVQRHRQAAPHDHPGERLGVQRHPGIDRERDRRPHEVDRVRVELQPHRELRHRAAPDDDARLGRIAPLPQCWQELVELVTLGDGEGRAGAHRFHAIGQLLANRLGIVCLQPRHRTAPYFTRGRA